MRRARISTSQLSAGVLLRAVSFEVRPRESTDVVDVVLAIDLSGHAVGPTVGIINAVDFEQLEIPAIDEVDGTGSFPAELANAILGEAQCDRDRVGARRGRYRSNGDG